MAPDCLPGPALFKIPLAIKPYPIFAHKALVEGTGFEPVWQVLGELNHLKTSAYPLLSTIPQPYNSLSMYPAWICARLSAFKTDSCDTHNPSNNATGIATPPFCFVSQGDVPCRSGAVQLQAGNNYLKMLAGILPLK